MLVKWKFISLFITKLNYRTSYSNYELLLSFAFPEKGNSIFEFCSFVFFLSSEYNWSFLIGFWSKASEALLSSKGSLNLDFFSAWFCCHRFWITEPVYAWWDCLFGFGFSVLYVELSSSIYSGRLTAIGGVEDWWTGVEVQKASKQQLHGYKRSEVPWVGPSLWWQTMLSLWSFVSEIRSFSSS